MEVGGSEDIGRGRVGVVYNINERGVDYRDVGGDGIEEDGCTDRRGERAEEGKRQVVGGCMWQVHMVTRVSRDTRNKRRK
jgi:hypothetical protein